MRFLDPNLDVRILQDGRHAQLLTEFDYCVGSPEGTSIVRCEQGFVTDWASTPRLTWSVIPPTGRYCPAVLVHDKAYQSGVVFDTLTQKDVPISRKYADDVLAEACRVLAANEMLTFGAKHTEFADYCDRMILYYGVRLGGWLTWNRYRRQQAALIPAPK